MLIVASHFIWLPEDDLLQAVHSGIIASDHMFHCITQVSILAGHLSQAGCPTELAEGINHY